MNMPSSFGGLSLTGRGATVSVVGIFRVSVLLAIDPVRYPAESWSIGPQEDSYKQNILGGEDNSQNLASLYHQSVLGNGTFLL